MKEWYYKSSKTHHERQAVLRFGALLFVLVGLGFPVAGQKRFDFGMETTLGRAHTTFKGDLGTMIGFQSLEITRADLDTALLRSGIDAPRWLKDLFPGINIEVNQEIARQLSRPVKSARFFARYEWLGLSFSISDPRLTVQPESQKMKNQMRSLSLALSGDAEALSLHLATMALNDETRTKPFFNQRYDVEAHIDFKRLLMPNSVLVEWGNRKRNNIDLEVFSGLRFTADPSPVLDLGSVLFIRDRIDDLFEGGIFTSVESLTDRMAEAVQQVVFGRFRDPRVVPSMGWFLRVNAPVNFGASFSLLGGAEFSANQHTSVKGTSPMYSIYGYLGLRWRMKTP